MLHRLERQACFSMTHEQLVSWEQIHPSVCFSEMRILQRSVPHSQSELLRHQRPTEVGIVFIWILI